jgi:hypothetical protein
MRAVLRIFSSVIFGFLSAIAAKLLLVIAVSNPDYGPLLNAIAPLGRQAETIGFLVFLGLLLRDLASGINKQYIS